ncbi:hypothetical protein LIER_15102 [Lithospermum erythrorhizon]|uniref:Uncharacterized protein n=1 Tax=Lithospermum erythrorhizon TaxID=34254 RepID=A0AAV3Q657_LITER
MKFTKGKLAWGCTNKKQKEGSGNAPSAECDDCCRWCFSSSTNEERSIPKDVPKGHVVIYVGECHKRFVIKLNLLEHPLVKALLDEAHDVYDLPACSKLCISCDESLFLNVIQCAQSSRNRRAFTCL